MKWRADQPVLVIEEPAAPPAMDMALCLDDASAGGPTAARVMYVGWKWLQDHVGLVRLPLDSPLLARHIKLQAGRIVKPMAIEMPWVHIIELLLSKVLQGPIFSLLEIHSNPLTILPEQISNHRVKGDAWPSQVRGSSRIDVAPISR